MIGLVGPVNMPITVEGTLDKNVIPRFTNGPATEMIPFCLRVGFPKIITAPGARSITGESNANRNMNMSI